MGCFKIIAGEAIKTADHILLIGDNREMVSITGRLLERSGYQVWQAVGLEQAYEMMLKQMPRLIVMECELPDGSGITACRQIRLKKLPVQILLTSNDESDEVAALNAGADDFVKKPYRMEVLLARMNRLQQRS